MARLATGKRGIVCTNATYHGNSEAVGKLTRIGQPARNTAGDVRAIPVPGEVPADRARRRARTSCARPISSACASAIRSLEDDGDGLRRR